MSKGIKIFLHFKTQSLKLDSTDTEAVLTGRLTNGTLIKGIDSVKIIEKRAKQALISKISLLLANLREALSSLLELLLSYD